MNDSEVFRTIHPEMLLIGQYRGDIVAIDTPKNFDRMHGPYASCKIRPSHLVEFYFSERHEGPDLQLAHDELGRDVADITCGAMLTLLASLAHQRRKPARLSWLFMRYEPSYRRAVGWLERVEQYKRDRDDIARCVAEIARKVARPT